MPFPAFFMPMLIGAGTGALGGLLAGKDPLKGAALGAATGGLLGSIPAGAMTAQGATVAGTTAPTSMGVNLAPAAFADDVLSLAPTATGAGGMGINFASAPSGMGVENIGQYATGTGANIMATQPTMFDSLSSSLSPYFNPRDMGNVALQGLANQPQQQMPNAPAGGISRGQAPQGQDVMALLASMKQPERRRISLV